MQFLQENALQCNMEIDVFIPKWLPATLSNDVTVTSTCYIDVIIRKSERSLCSMKSSRYKNAPCPIQELPLPDSVYYDCCKSITHYKINSNNHLAFNLSSVTFVEAFKKLSSVVISKKS